jgi:outer membrane protein TolC
VDRDLIARDADHRDLTRCMQQLRIDDALRHRRQLAAAEAQMGQGDQGMRLAPTECCLQAVQGWGAVLTGETAEDIGEDHAQALRGIRRVAKELLGVGVQSVRDGRSSVVVIHHLAQAGREDLWVERALQDILAGLAGVLNR